MYSLIVNLTNVGEVWSLVYSAQKNNSFGKFLYTQPVLLWENFAPAVSYTVYIVNSWITYDKMMKIQIDALNLD